MKTWTITRQLAVGFMVLVALTTLMGAMSVYSLQSVADSKDDVINYNARNLSDAQKLFAAAERESSASRGYLITGSTDLRDSAQDAAGAFDRVRGQLADRARSAQAQSLLEEVDAAKKQYDSAKEALVQRRAGVATEAGLSEEFDSRLRPLHAELARRIQAFIDQQNQALDQSKEAANEAVRMMVGVILTTAVVAALAAAFFTMWLTRRLSSQIGSTIHNVRSSSVELESAANEQATGAKQQSSAMKEISTTMTELLSTSRQITDSAQRVAEIAGKTETAAGAGGQNVREVAEAVSDIRQQVEFIVEHMLELGDKSQRIGLILELIDELAEQTNILAINATIEAAGAGDAGRRFGVVADEIRKLSDRVANSTGEIRTLVDEIQEASSATVMATEGGVKAVEEGDERFAELTAAFEGIANLVEATTEAAQEIELSTTQQTSAVEQVNAAINDVAQAAREAETATSQTFQTASELASISDEMGRLIESK